MDIFERRSMTESAQIMFKPAKAVFNKLFSNIETYDTLSVDLDIEKEGRTVAPYIERGQSAVGIKSGTFESETYTPPLIKLFTPTNAGEMLSRMAGENPYENRSPTERAAAKLLKDQIKLDNMIQQAEELQCIEAALTGMVTAKDVSGNTLAVINYNRNADLTVTTDWSDASANPITDLSDWRARIGKYSGKTANIVFMGSLSAKQFLANQNVQNLLDNRNILVGTLEQQAIELGVTFLGVINGMELYQYDSYYMDNAGVLQPVLDEKKVILASSFAEGTMLYGGIANFLDGVGIAEGTRFSFSNINEDGDIKKVHLQSAPLALPKYVDGFLGATVLP